MKILQRDQYLLPLANMAMRGLALVGRFGLVIYVAQFIGLEALGLFALVQGVAGIAPPALGWGLSYFLSRDIVDLPPLAAGRMLRDRLFVTIVSLAAAVGVVAITSWTGLIRLPEPTAMIILIICLEAIAFDIHMAMISLGKPIAANALLFVRSAAWVAPAVVLGVVSPGFRSLEPLYWFWLGGLLLNMALLVPIFRNWPIREILRSPLDVLGLVKQIRNGWLIYLNDVAIVGTLYLDRYVVGYFLGLKATGLFSLYWSVANAAHVLVTTAVIQISLPTLVRAYRTSGAAHWLATLRGEAVKIVLAGTPLLVAIFVVTVVLLPLVGFHRFQEDPILFLLMLISVLPRLLGDLGSYGLYSRSKDGQFARINLSGVLLAIVLSVLMVNAWGLLGAATAMNCTAIALLVIRLVALSRIERIATPAGFAP
jgi:O-antigen/teichoic acid export membrane protein